MLRLHQTCVQGGFRQSGIDTLCTLNTAEIEPEMNQIFTEACEQD